MILPSPTAASTVFSCSLPVSPPQPSITARTRVALKNKNLIHLLQKLTAVPLLIFAREGQI